jgi:hypothetical protein
LAVFASFAWKIFMKPFLALFLCLLLSTVVLYAQDSTAVKKKEDKITLLVYVRVIHNPDGTYRVDENIVPNFKLNRLLRLEVGFRQGQTSGSLGSYNHYKVELQTRWFYSKFRFFTRLSDRIVRYPTPPYSNSNYMMVAESRFPLGRSFSILAAAGYVYTFQHNNTLEGLPITDGAADHFPTYKLALRYDLHGKGFVEAVYGAYDVFNPYPVTAPFTQASFDYHLSHHATLYSYFRYQFSKTLDVPLSEFMCVGVRFMLK